MTGATTGPGAASGAAGLGVPPGLRAAYAVCRRVQREYGRTYFLATRLLPRERRPHVWALYAFARTADDLVDEPSADPRDTLPAWSERALGALAADAPPDPVGDPVLAAAWHTRRALGLRMEPFEDFAASMLMDLDVTRYATHEDLGGYMSGSAAAIGEMMAPLLGAPPSALAQARALGDAFQLTNFVRDVAEDLRRGRVYLPLASLEAHGVGVADLERAEAAGRSTPAVKALVSAEVDHALAVYEQARPGVAAVDGRARPCVRVAFDLYRQILLEVRARDHEVFAGRVTVSRPARAAAVARVLTRPAPRAG